MENKSICTLIGGDFNCKIGKFQEGDRCLGKFSKGQGNINGEALAEFCESKSYYIINSNFQHSSRHITTWQGTWKDKEGKLHQIYNQIDFILCKQKDKTLFQNARTYNGTKTQTDHRLVKASMVMSLWKIRNKKTKEYNLRYDTSRLSRDDETKLEYQEEMRNYVRTNTYYETKSPQENWNNMQKGMKEAAEKKVGHSRKVGNTYDVYDEDIQELSNRQKKIRIEIDNTKEPDKKKELKAERNKIQHQISRKVQEIREKEIDMKIEDIENSSDTSKMFKAVGTLYRQKYENPKVEDDEKGD